MLFVVTTYFKPENFRAEIQSWDLQKLRREEFLALRRQLSASASGYGELAHVAADIALAAAYDPTGTSALVSGVCGLAEADSYKKRLQILQAEVRRRGLAPRKADDKDDEAAAGAAISGDVVGGATEGANAAAAAVAEGASGAATEGMDYHEAC